MKVIRFTATWCQPCKTLVKVLEQEGLNIPAVDIDTAEGKSLVAHYGIRSVPTIVVDDGTPTGVTKFTGANLSVSAKETLHRVVK